MRFMTIVKASEASEKGVMPSEQRVADLDKYNEELAKADVLLDSDGLAPTSEGARVMFSGGKRSVIDGPFAESKEPIAGYWLIQAKAVEWAKRAPNPHGGGAETHIEVRLFEIDDFGQSEAANRRAS